MNSQNHNAPSPDDAQTPELSAIDPPSADSTQSPASKPSTDSTDKPSLIRQLASDQQLQQQIEEAMGDADMAALMAPSVEDQSAPTQAAASDSSAGGDQMELTMDIRRGRVASVSGDDVFVDLAGVEGKNSGVAPLKQFSRAPRVGAIMDFVVDRFDESDGLYILSREGALRSSTWDNLHKGAPIEARVTATNKGGLELELVGAVKAFMPMSQIDLGHVDDPETFVGQKIPAIVEEIDRKSRQVILSRKAYLLKHRQTQRRKLLAELAVGDIRQGTVTGLKPYGVFVDIGGVDGMVHISDLSYTHVGKPQDVVNVGDQVQVRVLKIEPDKKRISLGIKQIEPDPWEGVAAKYNVGEEVSGRVVRTADFGAFIELEPGVEGLLPISEMSWGHIREVEDVLKAGDVIRLRILAVDVKKQRISLSLKQIQPDPWAGASDKFAVGEVVEGKVTSTTDFGAFVEIEAGVEAMVHISELSPQRVGKVTDVLNVGDVKQFKVIQVDSQQHRMKLSLKAVTHPGESAPSAQHRGAPTTNKPKRKPHKPGNLKGGMGSHGGMGIGLGDLKL